MPSLPRASAPGRALALVGGLLFAATLIYFAVRYAAFGAATAPWTGTAWRAVFIDIALFTVFALHHSAFARTGLKEAVHRRVSQALERSVYVWVASLLFAVTLWAWTPVPGTLWSASGAVAWALSTGCLCGIALTAVAASALDPLELAGIRQAWGLAPGEARALTTTGAYGLVRHPIYLGWVLMVWSVPHMTGTRLVFAAISTLYLLVAIPLEERELHRTLGPPYAAYTRLVRWKLIPGVH